MCRRRAPPREEARDDGHRVRAHIGLSSSPVYPRPKLFPRPFVAKRRDSVAHHVAPPRAIPRVWGGCESRVGSSKHRSRRSFGSRARDDRAAHSDSRPRGTRFGVGLPSRTSRFNNEIRKLRAVRPAPRNPHKRVGFDVRPGHARRRGRSNHARPAVRAIQPRLRGLLRGAQHPNGFRVGPARGETRRDVLRRRVHAGDAVP